VAEPTPIGVGEIVSSAGVRIALFTEVFLPKIDGITNRLGHTLRCLEAEGHECLLFAPDTALRGFGATRVVRIPSLPFPPYPGVRVSLPDPRLVAELLAFRPDVVHAVGPALLGVMGIAAARGLGLPIVASYHTDFARYLPGYGLGFAERALWPLIRAVHGPAHVNLCPSRFTQRELELHGVRGVGIWRGGVDAALFHPRRRSLAMRVRLAGGRPEGPLLLSVGRLSAEKNLESFAEILDELPDARLALVGDGPARGALERALARQLAAGRVHFAGFLRGEELARAYASADLFVMPSRTETLGFVALEAMASGLPVVAAHAGGLPDVVQHEENGLLYHPERPREGAEAIRRLLAHEAERRFFARLARKSAESASWPAETRRLLDAYRRAIVLSRQSRGALRRLGALLVA
jgi:glycosyltransferase involved in cell wall biosynthesis